jgi:3-dehydroquinate synthase
VPPFDALPLPAELSALDWLPLVVSSVTYKNEIIQLDYKDNHLRKVLNFGHTIGHVLESHSLKNGSEYLLHGEAVALGMMIELVLSVKYASFPEEKMFKYMRFLRMHFNDLKFPSFDDGMIPLLSLDKKNSNGVIKCVLLGEEGNPLIDQVVEVEEVMQAMRLLNESGTLFS